MKGDPLMRTLSVVVEVFAGLGLGLGSSAASSGDLEALSRLEVFAGCGFLSSATHGYPRKQKTGVGTRVVPLLRDLVRHSGVAAAVAVVIWVIVVFRAGGGSFGWGRVIVERTGGPVAILLVFFCGGRRRNRGHARRGRLKQVKEVKIMLDLYTVCIMVGVADKSAGSARGYPFA
jgi:hypothetical protein